jgi:hypothetical protein
MARVLRRFFGFWVVPGSILVLLGLGITRLLQPAGAEPSPPAVHVSPAADEEPDEDAMKEFARNPVQYHLIPRFQGRLLPPPSLR